MLDRKWSKRFVELARLIASWSKDPSTKCGCVIVRPDRTVSSMGYNGFPRGVNDHDGLLEDRDEKLFRIIHAEENAILNAKEPWLSGYTLFVVPLMPCAHCAALIIQNRIERVIYEESEDEEKLKPWRDSFERSRSMFREAGVELFRYVDDQDLQALK